jgi:polyphosphate kinase 2 (PPK2 family)
MKTLVAKNLRKELVREQLDVINKGTPVLVIFEGGSGRVISKVVNEIDRVMEPRRINYWHFDVDTHPSKAFARMLQATPAKSEIVMFDRSWYALAVDRYEGDPEVLDKMVKDINRLEEYLLDNGTCIIKIRLEVSAQIMKQYAEEYRPTTAISGTFLSVDHLDHYKYYRVMDDFISGTDSKRAPWDIVKVGPLQETVTKTVRVLIQRFAEVLEGKMLKVPHRKHVFKEIYPNPRKGLELAGEDIPEKELKKRIEKLSKKLETLQVLLSVSGRTLILGFEGWDAAGKGGCIKQITHALNPRGYRVMRVGKPTDVDYAHTYLWRFARNLPSPGRIAIYDRTWYGRMMVEPIEKLCKEEEYARSVGEINTFEGLLSEYGAIVIKFWLDIDKDTQLERFNARQADPLKSWKLTDEDWRNRDKWDVYEEYVDRMISTTNTPAAPWVVVPANNKKYAQYYVLKTVVDALEKELKP